VSRSAAGDFFVRRNESGFAAGYQLVDAHGVGVDAANALLEATALRGFAPATVRTYAFALRHAWRWMAHDGLTLDQLTEAHLFDFIGFLGHNRPGCPLAPRSINLALAMIRRCYSHHTGRAIPGCAAEPTPARCGRPWRLRPRLRQHRRRARMTVPQHLPVPLEPREVTRLWESFRTLRDLAMVSLMFFCGLRSREVLGLTLEDLDFDNEALRVRGKGNKDRVLPMPPEVRDGLETYRRLERPRVSNRTVFLVLKGPRRGRPLSVAGLRSVFRHHRGRTGTMAAHPHRFRHTFAVEMVRAGTSLPTLMRLMGHTNIDMTLRYVNLSPEDLRKEFLVAVRKRAAWLSGE
jgi:site-specific recombinase XerD